MSVLRSPAVAVPPSPHTQQIPGRVVRQRLVPFKSHSSSVRSLMAAETKHFTANDGVQLAYETAGSSGPVIVLIHGWSGSKKYFQRNIAELAAKCKVYALDLRHHGDSNNVPARGYHIARLAADLRDFLETLDIKDATVVGSSMGCAVIWSYVELFGTARLKSAVFVDQVGTSFASQSLAVVGGTYMQWSTERLKSAVFVDQSPLQNRAPDWDLGSRGCYNEATLHDVQRRLAEDLGSIADGNNSKCLSLPIPEDILAELRTETLRCKPDALGLIMADHTQLDWRPVLPLLKMPCLNMIGGCSGVFPNEGCLHISKAAPDCCSVVFKRANHWLYLEQPEEFNRLLLDFVEKGNDGRADISYVE